MSPRGRGEGKTPHRALRIEDEDWAPFGAECERLGVDRSALIREHIRWVLHTPGAKAPRRLPNAIRWTGSNLAQVQAIRPDARLNDNGDLIVDNADGTGQTTIAINYVVHRADS